MIDFVYYDVGGSVFESLFPFLISIWVGWVIFNFIFKKFNLDEKYFKPTVLIFGAVIFIWFF